MLKGINDYHNFIRLNSALDGKTPAEVAGVNLGLGEKKWEELIRHGIRAKNGKKEDIGKKLSENRTLDSYL